MTPALHIDVTRGGSALELFAALIDLGVAPSPILHTLAELELPVELRVASGPTRLEPHPDAPMPVALAAIRKAIEQHVSDDAGRIALDAIGRLVWAAHVEDAVASPAAHASVEAASVAAIVGAVLGIIMLAPDEVRISRIGVPHEPDAALVELLGDAAEALDFGGREMSHDLAALLVALDGDFGAAAAASSASIGRAGCVVVTLM